MSVFRRLWNTLRPERLDREIDDELEFHREMRRRRARERGLGPEEADFDARRRMGSLPVATEGMRDARVVVWLSSALQDLRHGLRLMRRNPGFTLAAVLSLSLGIGASTAVFSVINAAFLQPLPWHEASRIVRMSLRLEGDEKNPAALFPSDRETFEKWRRNTKLFTEVAAVSLAQTGLSLTGLGDAEHYDGALVSSNYFALLGAAPALGRTFLPEEDQAGRANVAILSNPLWRTRFNADPATIGRDLMLNGQAYKVIGVMPAGFRVPTWYMVKDPDIWLPLDRSKDVGGRFMGVLGRVSQDATPRQAEAEASALAGRDALGRRLRCQVAPLTSDHDDARPLMTLLFGVVTLVLLVACANVANLNLARATVRTREMGIRSAIGAGRRRLLVQMLVENALLVAVAGAVALLFVEGVIAVLRQARPTLLPRVEELSLDWRVFVFASVVSVVAGLAAGFLPALGGARLDVTTMLGAASERGGDSRFAIGGREALIVVQTMLSVMLLAGAGLLGRSLLALSDVDLGFQAQNTLTFRVMVPEHWSQQQISRFFTDVRQGIGAIPQVESVAYTDFSAPLEGTGSLDMVAVGSQVSSESPVLTLFRHISPGYFRVLGIPLVAGSDFTESPLESWRDEVVVNETFARRHWPGENAIGKLIYPAGAASQRLRIIGVVKDVREHNRAALPQQEVYFPNPGTATETMFAVRTAGDPAQIFSAIRRAVASVSPEIAAYEPRRLTDIVTADIAPQTFLASVLAGFAGVAALLAAIGLYGVVSYAANRRTREIAVRLALGATGSSILRAIGGRYLTAAGIGIASGLVGSALSGGIIRHFLFQVEPYDPQTLASVTALLVVAAAAATWFPVRRALSMAPMDSLRQE